VRRGRGSRARAVEVSRLRFRLGSFPVMMN
jgi:hypothetical protein